MVVAVVTALSALFGAFQAFFGENEVVKKIMDFGAFIEILPGKDGLCHISKLAAKRVNKVSDVVKEGERIRVRVVEVDKLGRINLSAVNVDDPDQD